MAVPSFNPQLQVILRKTVRARAGTMDRFRGAQAEIDLSPYLGETSTVTTQRGINQPAGGFTIRVGDRLYPAQRQVAGAVDSLYGLVEPMDVVEIRMRRMPGSGRMPLVMRGLVSGIEESEALADNGQPQRFVTVTGQDWGKWLQIIQIKYLRGQNVGDLLSQLSGALLQYRYGIPYISLSGAEFVSKLIGSVVNPYIAGLAGDTFLPQFKVNTAGSDPRDVTFPQGLQANPEGTIWTYLQRHGNLGPFYEAFIDDEEAGPTFVYRKPPFYDLDGQTLIFPSAADALIKKIPVPASDILNLRVARSDADVANWFFVRAGRNDLLQSVDSVLLSMTSDATLLSAADYPNSAANLYGTRLMEVETHHGALAQGAREAEAIRQEADLTAYVKKQIALLKASNRDNVVYESGSMTVKGAPGYRPGRYVEIDRRGMKSSAYVTSVVQTFEPFRSYKALLSLIRGTGFAVRSMRDSERGHPYRSMIGRGVYP